MEGRPWAEFPLTHPEDARRWNLEPWLFAPEGGEPMQAVYDRIWQAVGDIVTAGEGGAVAVASHGCAIRNLLCRAKGWPIQRLGEVAWCDNTGVSICLLYTSCWTVPSMSSPPTTPPMPPPKRPTLTRPPTGLRCV